MTKNWLPHHGVDRALKTPSSSRSRVRDCFVNMLTYLVVAFGTVLSAYSKVMA